MPQPKWVTWLLKPRWFVWNPAEFERVERSPCQYVAHCSVPEDEGSTYYSLSILGWINGLFTRLGLVLLVWEGNSIRLGKKWW